MVALHDEGQRVLGASASPTRICANLTVKKNKDQLHALLEFLQGSIARAIRSVQPADGSSLLLARGGSG
jgi:hypothetical protein